MIVEDNAMNLELATDLLEIAGYILKEVEEVKKNDQTT